MGKTIRKIALGVSAVALTAGIGMSGAATASADPISDIGAAGYQALFDAHVPVYEVVGVEHHGVNSRPPSSVGYSDGQYLHFVRVPNAQAGQPGTVKYAIGGAALPNEFWLPQNFSGATFPIPSVNPRPSSYGQGTVWDYLPALVGQIGPVGIAGVPGPIAGAIAIPR
ncbi:hypothetical protein [Prescottella subtropica]|uniref:hypothetical protein n=1 Tax=Prescottella subtropica TaxID=2545757 RepID=UPI0013874A93|nr:hypothetical protein [Prescottella subtropica]